MKRLFAVVLAVACVAGSTSGFARGGMGHFAGGGRGGHGVNPAFLQNSAPQMPAFETELRPRSRHPRRHPLSMGRCPSPHSRG